MENSDEFTAANVPVYVTSVSLIGIGKTNADFLKNQLAPLVKSKDMHEFLENSSKLKSMLTGLQIFKFCEISLDTDKHLSRSDAYTVNIFLEEKKAQNVKAQCSVNTDGSMRMGGYYALNNIFRKAERLEIEGNVATDASKTRLATFVKPFAWNPNIKFSFGGSDCSYDHWWCKLLRNESSVFTELSTISRFGVYKIHCGHIWREVEASSSSTPFSLRLESGASLKTTFRHSVEVDSRDDRIFPQKGVLFRFSEELAFLHPPSHRTGMRTPCSNLKSTQLRVEGLLQKPLRLTDWLTAETTLSAGFVHSLSGHPVSTVDRFFLGGPMELRGFSFCKMGPSEAQLLPMPSKCTNLEGSSGSAAPEGPTCPSGGLASCVAGLHLYTPLPFLSSRTVDSFAKLHAFSLTGCLLADSVRDWRMARATAASVAGVGLVLRFAGAIRLEINYCIPFGRSILFARAASPSNLPDAGFQLGIGVNYS